MTEAALAEETDRELHDLLQRAADAAPPLAPTRWRVDAVRSRFTLARDAPIDRAAWIQLGATIEAIAIAGAANGLAIAIDGAPSAPAALVVGTRSIPPGAQRLAACLGRPPGAFRDPPLRFAGHSSARLAAAAAAHACALHWTEGLAPGSPGDAPAGACAVGALATRVDDAADLVRAGQACCRVWLEAISLGLAVRPVDAALPATRDPSQVAAFWFGVAA